MPERDVDLRSDTLTLPTEEMKEAMYRAVLGDDCYGDDPTVNQLQELAASRVGMEAALYVPSGTMGNTSALLAHTHMGDEVIIEELAHMYNWECGAFAHVAGLAVRPVRGEYGVIRPEQLEELIRPANPHFPRLSLVCIENTHNNSSGSAWSPDEVAALSAITGKHGLKLHMDGARIFNAAIACGVDVKEYTRHVDSLMFCISKGLSAPVGSLLCGSRAFIDRAYGMRKRLGGAMRQAGVIAAAGIVALEKMVDRLAEDHENARLLGEGLAAIDGLQVQQPPRPTNIFIMDVGELGWTSEDLIEKWKACGIRCNPRPPTRVRVVTHRHIKAEDVAYVIDTTRRLVEAG